MGNFDKGGRGGNGSGRPGGSGGRPSFGGRSGGGRPSFGGRDDRGPVTMHKVNCNECGNVAEVPFKPTGEKPVFCNDCFGGKKESSSRSFDTRFDSRADKRPAANTAVYSSTPRAAAQTDPRIGEMKSQIEALNSKMDRVIEMMRKESVAPVAATTTKAVEKESVKKVVAVTKTVAPKKVVAKTAPKKVVAPKAPAVAKKVVAVTKTVAPKKVVAKKSPAKKK